MQVFLKPLLDGDEHAGVSAVADDDHHDDDRHRSDPDADHHQRNVDRSRAKDALAKPASRGRSSRRMSGA